MVAFLFSIVILALIIYGTKILLREVPAKYLNADEAYHSKVDKITLWIIGILGLFFAWLTIDTIKSPAYTLFSGLKLNLIPFFILWLLICAMAIVLIKVEAHFTKSNYIRRHGMSKDLFENHNSTNNNFVPSQVISQYGKPSNAFPFVHWLGRGHNAERLMCYTYDGLNSLVICSESQIVDIIPYNAIIDLRVDAERTIIKEGSSKTVTNGFFFPIFFFLLGRSRSRTTYKEALTANRYTIRITLNSLKYPEFKMYFGMNEADYNHAHSILKVIINRNKSKLDSFTTPPVNGNYMNPSLLETT